MQAQTGKFPPIAIVGVSGKFPGGANGLEQLWSKLKAGEDLVRFWPKERWDHGFYHPDADREGRIYVKSGGFLDQIDQFDAEFFGIVPREAARLDPQQRILLELSWEALEEGGLRPECLAGSRTGVFVGVSSNDYATLQGNDPDSMNAYSNAGGALSITANRVSYFFDFRGPSMAIDTACSSSLVALHEACRSLWSGEITLSLVGGVNTLLHPGPFVGFCKASMLSPDGRCKSFDADANGYVRAEGGVVLVLKPLQAAERDHDRIHALIVATGVNSDGRTRGLALPNEYRAGSLVARGL